MDKTTGRPIEYLDRMALLNALRDDPDGNWIETIHRFPAVTLESLRRAQQERENPKPLTPEEFSMLASRDPNWGTHVFVKSMTTGKVFHALADIDYSGVIAIIGAHGILYLCNYGLEWIAYATEPKGEST